jgi:hypothetical protein
MVLLVKVDGLVESMKERPPCPSLKCQDHEGRLITLESSQSNQEKAKLSVQAWAAILIMAALAAADLLLQLVNAARSG